MSMIELTERAKVDRKVKLWLEESINNYILEKVEYGALHIDKKSLKRSFKRYFYDGYIIVRERYSKVRMKVLISDIYKWHTWRVTELWEARRKWLKENPERDSYGLTPVGIDYLNNRTIIKGMKGFN